MVDKNQLAQNAVSNAEINLKCIFFLIQTTIVVSKGDMSMSDFIILVAPFLIVFLSLTCFFFWVLKSKEPYEDERREERKKEHGV